MSGPVGVTVTASGTLFVGTNSRVMRFNNAANLGNGGGATAVLCQPDFASTTSGLSATQANAPWGVWVTPEDTLWVLDVFNSRALRFDNASSLPNGSAANGVVGQPDFVTNTGSTTDRRLSFSYYFPYVDATGSLWIPDSTNNRVLRFPPDVTPPALAVTSTVPKSTSKKSLTVKGTASDAYGISKVTYKVNTGNTRTATGTTSWQFKAALKKGKNTIIINAVDSVNIKSAKKVLKIVRN
jgi:Bacterial Ig domain